MKKELRKQLRVPKNTIYKKSAVSKSGKENPIKRKLTSLFLIDDNSRMSSGKKLTITRKKKKKKKPQNSNLKISYPTFTRFRPFWVIKLTDKDRHTYMCKLCENFRMILRKSNQLKFTELQSMSIVSKLTTCEESNKGCNDNTCSTSKFP
ncbi:hypothetical protein PR048_014853 [Dryococelus australis]|uniref:Uncharacterized protein n=1 Tax=Dryococelus australis TaxID=614101 RepID=A0ABQ9HFH6_9NEOP|nr:hypothetical protein PR048_014853 [Dryococelus australis]